MTKHDFLQKKDNINKEMPLKAAAIISTYLEAKRENQLTKSTKRYIQTMIEVYFLAEIIRK